MNQPLLGTKVPSPGNAIHSWELEFGHQTVKYLQEHGFQSMSVVPGSAYIEAGIEGIITTFGHHPYHINNVTFQNLLLIEPNTKQKARLDLSSEDNLQWLGRIVTTSASSSDEDLVLCEFNLHTQKASTFSTPSSNIIIHAIRDRCEQEFASTKVYNRFRQNKNEYGPTFRSIANLYLGSGESLSSLRLHSQVESEMYRYYVHPSILDACVQTLACIDFDRTDTYMWAGVDEITIYQLPTKVGWIHAVASASNQHDSFTGSVMLYDTEEQPILEMKGVKLKYLSTEQTPRQRREEQNKVVIAASFTAEPIESTLNFWLDKLDIPSEISFAPYNQIFQQLLDPASELSTNSRGANVILLRLEDWLHTTPSLVDRADQEKTDRLLSQRDHHTLPNQLKIAHLNGYETDYLYQEIFVDQTYLKHGIDIPEDACVIDVGANIGMFTLFILHQAPNAHVYSFEPSPPAFAALSANATLYGKNVFPFNCGISDHNGEATFTFYNNSSVFSSFHADVELDKAAIQTVVENVLVQTGTDEESLDTMTEQFMESRLQKQTFPCQLKTLSTIIDEEDIGPIDLLKIDVEKSELHVLRGIRAEHWPKIRQIVVEVHDTEGPVIREVQRILDEQGFDLKIVEEDLLKESGLYNVYGRRLNDPVQKESESTPLAGSTLARNINDFIEGLTQRKVYSNTPNLVVLCPQSPSSSLSSTNNSVLEHAAEELSHHLSKTPNTYLIKGDAILRNYPVEQFYDSTGHQLGDVPYTPQFFSATATAIVRKLQAIQRRPFKVIVLDCDNTLWKGVVGEAGAKGVQIPHEFAALQSFMLEQHNAGMLLCLCSKNVEEDVLEVFEKNDEMILQQSHVVSTRVNWKPKSENIKSLAEELELGLDSFIFIDDNPVECAEVRAHCPQVLTLQLPSESKDIPAFLNHVWAFDHVNVTQEDRKRTLLYQQNVQRNAFQEESITFASFIEGLQLEIDISSPQETQYPRVAQLTQRTNQFNMTTRRRSESDIVSWVQSEATGALVVSVRDRFGDYGLVGVVLYSAEHTTLIVDSFMLSCRVLGKGVEHAMLRQLGAIARDHGLSEIHLPYIKTAKNKPALAFLLTAKGMDERDFDRDTFTFTFATEEAAQLIFEPAHHSQNASSGTKDKKRDLPKVVVDSNYRLIEEIANHLQDPQAILEAAQTQNVRSRPDQSTQYIAPSKDLEQSIAQIWQEVLGIDQIGVEDNFFEIGGSSLKAVQVISKLRSQLQLDISLVNIFDKPNIRSLVNQFDQENAPTGTSDSRQRGEMRRSRRVRRDRLKKS